MNDDKASESEIAAAAERTVRWQVACGDGTHEQHEYGSDPDLQRADESELIDWAVARLAADRAERDELARPIDAEWCAANGGMESDDAVTWGWSIRGLRVEWSAIDGVTVASNCGHWAFLLVANCRDFGDLLRVLKGGVE